MGEDVNIITPKDFVNILKKRVKNDWDAVVGITGEEGSSKSTLASWLVYEGCVYDGLTEEECLKQFVDYTIFSPNKERVQEQIINSTRYSIINADEAIKILYKQNWATPIQKFLNMFYALCRQENKISVLCMPRFLDFNEFFRNHRIKFWIHVLDRGVAVMFERDWFPASADPWFIKEAQKLNYVIYSKRKTGDFNTEQKIQALSKLKNFIGVIKFDDLTTKLKNKYKEKKAEFAYQDLEEQIKQGDGMSGARVELYKNKLVMVVKTLAEKNISMNEISRMTNLNPKTVKAYVELEEDFGTPNNSNELYSSPNKSHTNNNQMNEDNFD